MNRRFAITLLLACAACSQEDPPSDQLAAEAEAIVAPAAAEPAPLAKGRYAPQDTCAEVEGADAFRRQLAAAIEARDADALAALAASDVKLDFGGGAGAAELRKRLDDKSWDLWPELDELMRLGCSANDQGGITIPWFFDQDLGTDPFSGMLVTGEDVPVLAEPDAASRPLATVSWDVVEIAALDPESEFQRVELGDKTVGFIATAKLRSLLDYRLIASSRNGKWSVTSFIAGD
ncbi:MAG TPA: hypothetical protein VEB68_13290 [Croceibacterium sp.]|nr:hypothetical protein [Croceibacterium sp.]